MKKILLITLLISFISVLNGQETFIGISLGRGVPLNDFASTSTLETSGYALPGFTIGFEGVWFPVPYAGIGANIGFGSLYTEGESYQDNFISYIDNHPDLINLNIPTVDQFTYRPSYWNFINMMVGPELSLPIGDFRASAWLMGGMSVIFIPNREMFFDDGTDVINSYTKGTDLSFIYSYGGSLMYTLRSGTAINVSTAFYNTTADYDINLSVDSPVVTLDEVTKGSVDVQYFKVSIGLFYSF